MNFTIYDTYKDCDLGVGINSWLIGISINFSITIIVLRPHMSHKIPFYYFSYICSF